MPGLQVVSAPIQPTLSPQVLSAPAQPTLAPKVVTQPVQPKLAPRVVTQPQQPQLSPQVQSQPQGQQETLPVSYGHVIDSIVGAKAKGAGAQDILNEIIKQNPDAPATQDIKKALEMGADPNQILDKIIQDNYTPSNPGKDEHERGFLQETFGPELTGLASGARAAQSTWDILKGIVQIAKNDPETLRYALTHWNAPVLNAPAIKSALKTQKAPIGNVKTAPGMTNKELLGSATQAAGQALMVAGSPGTGFGLQGAGNAAQDGKGAGGIVVQGLLSALFGKGADMVAPYIGNLTGKAYEGLVPQVVKDVAEGVAGKAGSLLKVAGEKASPVLERVVPEAITQKTGTQAAKDFVRGKLTGPAINSLEDTYTEIFSGTKASKKAFDRSVAQGKTPARFLAENGYVVDVADGKINSQPLISKISQDVEPLETSLNDILAAKDKVLPESGKISLDDLGRQAKQRITNSATRGTGTLQDQYSAIDRVVENLKNEYGETVNLSDLNQIKRGQWKQSRTFDLSQPKYMSDINYALGKSAQQTIEKNVTETSIKDLNTEIGDHMDAIKNLQKIDGNAVKGGRLGKYFNRIIGSVIGSHFGPVGTIGGGLAADYISNLMQNNAIATPLKRAILSSIPEDSALYEAAQEALTKLKYGQPLLPAPSGGAAVQNNVPIEMPTKVVGPEQGELKRIGGPGSRRTINKNLLRPSLRK